MNEKLEQHLNEKNQELVEKIKELDFLKDKYENAYNTMKNSNLNTSIRVKTK